MKVKVKERVNWPITILLILGLVTVIFPLYLTVVIAFKKPSEMTNSISGILSLPKSWSFSNFAEAMRVTDFWHSLGNSVLITTTLYSSKPGRRFLISESVRGEGAVLYNKDGERFVNELLPRDVVTKAIREQMEKDGTDHVWLSMENIDKNTILEHFPNICERCREEGYDVTKEWIPVVPAQHYFMGGIWVDSDSRTSMEHLYAVGETSCNGVHGANRLASNSLLESLVFAKRAAHKISGVENAVNPVVFCKEAI